MAFIKRCPSGRPSRWGHPASVASPEQARANGFSPWRRLLGLGGRDSAVAMTQELPDSGSSHLRWHDSTVLKSYDALISKRRRWLY